MGSSQPEYTSIPVRYEDRDRAKEVKRQGESWSLFLRRATELINEDNQD